MKFRSSLLLVLWLVALPARANMFITWTNPNSVPTNQNYYVEATGMAYDEGYNLEMTVRKEGGSFAYNYGGYGQITAGAWTSDSVPGVVNFSAEGYDGTDGQTAFGAVQVTITPAIVNNHDPVATVEVEGYSSGATITRPAGGGVVVRVHYKATDVDGNLLGIRPQVWHDDDYFYNNNGNFIGQEGNSGEVTRDIVLDRNGEWYFWTDAKDTIMSGDVNSGAFGDGFHLHVVEAEIPNTPPVAVTEVEFHSSGDTIVRPYGKSVQIAVHYKATDADANLTGIRPRAWKPDHLYVNPDDTFLSPQNAASGDIVLLYDLNQNGDWYFWTDARDARGEEVNSGAFGDGFVLHVEEAENQWPVATVTVDGHASGDTIMHLPGQTVQVYVRFRATDVDGNLTKLRPQVLHPTGHLDNNGGNFINQANGSFGEQMVPVTLNEDGDWRFWTDAADSVSYPSYSATDPWYVLHFATVPNEKPVATVTVDGHVSGDVVTRPLGQPVTVTVRYQATDVNGNLSGVRPQVLHPNGQLDNNGGAFMPRSGGVGGVLVPVTLNANGIWEFWTDATDASNFTYTTDYTTSGHFQLRVVEEGTVEHPPVPSVTIDGYADGATITRPLGGNKIVTVRFKATDADGNLSGIRPHATHPADFFYDNNNQFEPKSGSSGEMVVPITLDRNGDWYFWTEATDTSSPDPVSSGPAPGGFHLTVVEDTVPEVGTGLMGRYYHNVDFSALVQTRTDATVDFNWGGGSPMPEMDPDYFSVIWSGKVRPKYSETYTFTTTSDDGVRLWVNNRLVIDHWGPHGPEDRSGTISLTAGKNYDIVMAYYELGGGAMAKLRWSSASQPLEVVPTASLFPLLLPIPSGPGGPGGPGEDLDDDPPIPPSSPIVGTLPGALSVDNKGAANYAIPLTIPPGRAGLQPAISLVYNSGGGNGPLGVGFTLTTGFPQSITRGRSIFARDGVVHPANFDADDKFYLDGKRLICIAGTYGLPGSTYRTEVDSFVTITASGTDKIDAFTLTDKSGTTMSFGKDSTTTDGYQLGGELFMTPSGLAYAYAIKRVEDTLGNYVSFFYSNPAPGEYHLREIDYTGGSGINPQASVLFSYTNNRRDKGLGYIGRRSFPLTRRLSQISTAFAGSGAPTTTAIYTFRYDPSPGPGNSRLASITPSLLSPSGGGFAATPPTALQWSNDAIGFTNGPGFGAGQLFPAQGSGSKEFCLFGDVNGDGRDDMVTSGAAGIRVALSTGTGFAEPTTWSPYGGAPIIKLCDLNGDGLKDIVFAYLPDVPGQAMPAGLYALVSNGAQFVRMGGASGAPTSFYSFGSDFRDPTTNGIFFVSREKEAISSRITIADFTGDGRDDILIHRYDGKLKVIASTGGGFAAPVQTDVGAQGLSAFGNWDLYSAEFLGYYVGNDFSVSPMVGDFNGDGVADYAWMETIQNWVHVGGGVDYSFVQMNKNVYAVTTQPGGGFSPRAQVASHTYTPGPSNPMAYRENLFTVLPGDMNGDGLTDFLVITPTTKMETPDAPGLNTDVQQSTIEFSLMLAKGGTGAPQFAVSNLAGYGNNYKVNVNGEQLVPVFDNMEGIEFLNSGAYDPNRIEADFAKGLWLQFASRATSENCSFEDINGDGRADYLWYVDRPGSAGWWVMYSLGSSFAAPVSLPLGWTPAAPINLSTDIPGGHYIRARQSADINGDGLPDVVVMSGQAELRPGVDGILLRTGSHPNLVTSITNGLGRKTDIAYKAAKDDTIYTAGAAVAYPIRELRASTPVVSDVWHDSGDAGQPAQFSYQYSGNRVDLSGRGSLGFHSFVTLDRQTNLFKYQFLAQSFPMTGLSHREETYRYLAANSFDLISSHDNTVVFDKVSTAGGATLWPFISQAIESRWEDGAGHLTTGGSSVSSDPENLFPKAKPAGAHITIKATSRFDEQTSPQLALPTVSGYNPSDSDSSRQNTVAGTTTYATFSGLPGKITYGNLHEISTDFGGGFTETVSTTYLPPVGSLTGRIDTVSTSVESPVGGPETAPLKRFTYSGDTPLIASETTDAAGEELDLTTTYERDDRGRVTKTTISNAATGDRAIGTYFVSQATAFDSRFDLPTTTTNAESYEHASTTVYHDFLGLPVSVTDVNGAQTTSQYDALGRAIQVRDELKSLQTDTVYASDASVAVAPPEGVSGLTLTSAYSITTSSTVQPPVKTWYDRLGRAIRTSKTGFNDQVTTVDTIYNVLGQTVAVSNPFGGWTKTTYDALGRVATITAPNGTTTTHLYQGRATTVTVDAPNLGGADPAPQTNAALVDAKGRTVKVWNADNVPAFTDNVGSTTTAPSIAFSLDGFGRMRETRLKDQTQIITATYDALGHQETLNDPDKGAWSYRNNALGQVVRQQDARNNVTTSTFDRLGRPLARTTTGNGANETANFYYYDSTNDADRHLIAKGEKGWIGAPQREEADTTGAGGFDAPKTTNLHYYDDKGRPAMELAESDGQWFYTYSDYDAYSRVKSVHHYWRPAGHEAANDEPYLWQNFGYTYAYDSKSYLLSLTDSLDRLWWDSPSYDLADRVISVRKGSGHTTQRTYRPTDGVLTAIKTGPTAGSSQIQNLSFGFDGLGNLRSRSDGANSETYGYDILNRLTERNGGVITSYFANGNIQNKTGVSGETTADYTYDATRPHAVATAFGYSMGYDANGNLLTRSKAGETWSMEWAGFDKPRWMAKTTGSTTVGSEFHYNAARSRVMQLEFDTMSGGVPSHYSRKRLYGLGATLEANYKNLSSSGAPNWSIDNVRIYVPGPDGIIGAREFSPEKPLAQQEKALVYHYDHLGSIQSITPFGSTAVAYATDESGKSGRYSEDAWGQRRDPLDWSGTPTTTDDGGADSLTPRGFTGHEMLDDLGLVHMNGRIYDPLLGRMLSADLEVQFPGESQSYNRYSYVRNNPVSKTDSSGFAEDLGNGMQVLPTGYVVVSPVQRLLPGGIQPVYATPLNRIEVIAANFVLASEKGDTEKMKALGAQLRQYDDVIKRVGIETVIAGALRPEETSKYLLSAGMVMMAGGRAPSSESASSSTVSNGAKEIQMRAQSAPEGRLNTDIPAARINSAAPEPTSISEVEPTTAPVQKGGANPVVKAAATSGSRLHSDQPGNLPDQLRNQYPETTFEFTPPGKPGQDVKVADGMHPSAYPGSPWRPGVMRGDFKPDTPSGAKTFKSDLRIKWNNEPTELLPYNPRTKKLNDYQSRN